ncbi:IS110 family transposase (plasmid) [Pontibrevibacter nitratireducens]|uniref:IS110 family transposase n=1 Tax=Pontivivens nitratireducens TaxID=2758038 RepID=A0A6G7VQN3_9RHOB|nr:IS110 family transposase [Pontibrevibacter nitratireducens]
MWSALDAAAIATRQLPPAQIKAFAASRGTRAKTGRIDAELIARFMAFRPDPGRPLPHWVSRHLRDNASPQGVPGRSTGPGKDMCQVGRCLGQTKPESQAAPTQ